MKATISGGGGLGLVVKISCKTCGREDTFPHAGFTGITCSQRLCGASQTITQAPAAKKGA